MHLNSRFAVTLLALAIAWGFARMSPAQTQQRVAPSKTTQAPRAAVAQPARQPLRTAQNPAQGPVPTGNVVAPQPGAATSAPAPVVPHAPFVLTEAQEKLLDNILIKWEKESAKVKTFVCKFTRYDVDPTFGPAEFNYTTSQSTGEIVYSAPDHGEYEIGKCEKWDKAKKSYVIDDQGIEHWMCDGTSIYEWDHRAKQLKVTPLPAQFKGKAIADGPLPFVFGAKAEELKRRYWMRDVTPQDKISKQIWLETHPKFQQDAANFQRATVVLDEKTFLPTALKLILPGIAAAPDKETAYTALAFEAPSINNPLNKLLGKFSPPKVLPFGWKWVDNQPAAAPPIQAQAPAAPAQAQRPAPGQRQ
jgi:TIGR03009 family protein